VWDANEYEVKALLKKNGKEAGILRMHYAGEASQFSGTCRVDAPGIYEAIVYAYDPANGNTGLDRVTFIVR
jgi:hypothetical protein